MSTPSQEALERAKALRKDICPHVRVAAKEHCDTCIAAEFDACKTDAIRDLAAAIKKVCPEIIPQIVAAAHPEEEFIKFLEAT